MATGIKGVRLVAGVRSGETYGGGGGDESDLGLSRLPPTRAAVGILLNGLLTMFVGVVGVALDSECRSF